MGDRKERYRQADQESNAKRNIGDLENVKGQGNSDIEVEGLDEVSASPSSQPPVNHPKK